MTEVWLGIQQSVIDQVIDQWRDRLDACVKTREKHFEHMLVMCYSATFNALL